METKAEFEEEWGIVEMGIKKLINIIEGVVVPAESPMDENSWMKLYTAVYTLTSNERLTYDHSKQLYKRYIDTSSDYLTCKALPAIQEKQNDHVSLLQEFVKRWADHKVMVSKFCGFLSVLDRYYINRTEIGSLKDGGFGCFREIVYDKMKAKVRDAVIALVNRERSGEEIDGNLVRDAVKVFVEIGNGNLDYYVGDFETVFLTDLVDYYAKQHGFTGITTIECMQKDKKVSFYLHSSTEEKLLKDDDDDEDPEKAKLIEQLLQESHLKAVQARENPQQVQGTVARRDRHLRRRLR